MAGHYENGYRLPHLPPGWLRQIELNDVINSRSRNSSIAYISFSCKHVVNVLFNIFTRATLSIARSLPCRRALSVCPSQAGIVSKQLNLS